MVQAILKISVKESWQIVHGVINPMVSNTALRVVVGAYFGASITSGYQ